MVSHVFFFFAPFFFSLSGVFRDFLLLVLLFCPVTGTWRWGSGVLGPQKRDILFDLVTSEKHEDPTLAVISRCFCVFFLVSPFCVPQMIVALVARRKAFLKSICKASLIQSSIVFHLLNRRDF